MILAPASTAHRSVHASAFNVGKIGIVFAFRKFVHLEKAPQCVPENV